MNSRPDMARPNRASSTPSIADVAVIGGGIVGAAAVLGAAQAGLSTVWVAGNESTAPASTERDLRVYAISPSTRSFLERLRVWPQLDVARIAPVREMRVFGDGEGRAALTFDAYEASAESLATIVEHRELVRVLSTAAAYFPGIERIAGMASIGTVDDDAVSLSTAIGVRQAHLVIAADGAASPTREAMAIAVDLKPYGQRAIVGNFASARPHGGAAFQWFTDEGVIALLPLPDLDVRRAVSLVWSAPDALADELMQQGGDAVAVRLSSLGASQMSGGIGPFESLGPLAAIALTMQSAHRLIAPRCALVGDAAHVVHPLAGQGLNLGLQDVEVLIDLLASREAFRDCGDPVVLRRYERARAEPVLAMRRMTDGLVGLFGLRYQGIARLRGLGMRMVDQVGPLKRLLMRHASGNA